MKLIKNCFTLIIVLMSCVVLASDDNACSAFPKNNIRISQSKKNLNLTRHNFESILKDFERIMSPVINQIHHKELKIIGAWEDDRVNATASRDALENPVITVSGGLARHSRMDRNGLFLILCHELGHQFGGAPKQLRGNTQLRSWSSAEGQADYYATAKCLPYLFEHLKDNTIDQNLMSIPLEVVSVCQSELCRKMAMSAHNIAMVFYEIKPVGSIPKINENDNNIVSQTIYSHPAPQCRLDTFISGAHCKLDEGFVFDDSDASAHPCSFFYSSPHKGARPNCWFDPRTY